MSKVDLHKNDLLDDLVADLQPVPRRRAGIDASIFGVLCIAQLGLFLKAGMARHDLQAAASLPSFWWKLASLGAIAIIAAAAAIGSFDPTRSARRGLHGVLVIALVSIVAGVCIDLVDPNSQDLIARLDGWDGIKCVGLMLALSLPAMIGLAVLMRRGAPTDRIGSSWAVGTAAAAWGAFVFMFACPHDDPLYIGVWYGLGCVAIAYVTRWMLPALTRW